MSFKNQNRRYKEDTVSSEITPDNLSIVNNFIPQAMDCSKSGLESSIDNFRDSFLSLDSEIVEFNYDRDDADGIVNLESYVPIDEEESNKHNINKIDLEDEQVQCKWLCLSLDDSYNEDNCCII